MNQDQHKELGIAYFNKTWEYLDNPHRSEADNQTMLHYAHASRLHWELSGAPILNRIRGDWMLANVYGRLGMSEGAMRFAEQCLNDTLQEGIGDFDLVFAYETMARAHYAGGDQRDAKAYLKKAYDGLNQVSSQDDRHYCKTVLDALKNDIG